MEENFSLLSDKDRYVFESQEQDMSNFDNLENKLLKLLKEFLEITFGSKETPY